MFGCTSQIGNIIAKFDEHFKDGKYPDENGLEYLKNAILENREKDKTWKICPVCRIEYDSKKQLFENILFIISQ